MLIAKGKVSPALPWEILEVAIGQAPDILAIRLSKELKRVHESGVEILVPMRRNADGDPEWIVEHVYVRGANGSLGKLARTRGIEFIRKERADPQWIARLLQDEPAQSAEIELGNFVRVLTGPCARMCGHVASIEGESLTVAIQMRTKRITVHTQKANAQLVDCPTARQVFYYQSNLFSS